MTGSPLTGGGRIVPRETALTAPYWEAARRGAILLQRCADCGAVLHPPAPVCPGGSTHELRWFESAGRGWLASYTSVVHAPHPAVQDRLPYLVALIELDEGPRIICNLVPPASGSDARPPDEPVRVTIRLGTSVGGLDLPVAVVDTDCGG